MFWLGNYVFLYKTWIFYVTIAITMTILPGMELSANRQRLVYYRFI